MNSLAVEVTKIVNKYIDEKGLTTEEVYGTLGMVAYRVAAASYIVDEPAETKSGGGSPVQLEEN